jgi:hypothetical protein
MFIVLRILDGRQELQRSSRSVWSSLGFALGVTDNHRRDLSAADKTPLHFQSLMLPAAASLRMYESPRCRQSTMHASVRDRWVIRPLPAARVLLAFASYFARPALA